MSRARETAELGGIPPGRRNLIINGAMQVAQRGTSGSVGSGFTFVLDRWSQRYQSTDELVATVTQDTDAPDGFSNSYKWTTNTGETTIAADEYVYVNYKMEGQDAQSLAYGSASAKSVTLSFWVKSSVTGTYAVALYQADGARIINKTYTIDSANTWEKKSVTIVGDTGGTINNDNGEGLRIIFHLAAGSDTKTVDSSSWVNYAGGAWAYGHSQDGVVTTTSATWQITGVQMEVGSVATEFEHRSYGEELALCQRYYFKLNFPQTTTIGTAYRGTTDSGRISLICPVPLRTLPSINSTNQPTLRFWWNDGLNAIVSTDGSISVQSNSLDTDRFILICANVTGLGNNVGSVWAYSGELEISAEL
jgi:hypothetical protein